MDTSWTRRGLAFLVLLVLLAGAVSVPVLASTGGDMEQAVESYEDLSDAKLEWLEHQLEAATSNGARRSAYRQATNKLKLYAEETVVELFVIAGNDLELLIWAEELAGEIHEMEQEYLAEATAMYEEAVSSATTTTTKPKNPTTTTVALTSTTTTTTLVTSTSTTVAKVSTTTSPTTSTTSTTTVPTSTTTVPAPTVNVPTRNSPPPGPDSPTNTTSTTVVTTTTTSTPSPVASASPSGTNGGIIAAPSGASDFALASEALPTDVGTNILSESIPVSDPDLMTRLGSSELLPITGMLLKYVPADLPGNMATPVVGLLAIFEMVVAAFVASLRQLGGPLTAAAMYLVYSVWRHLVQEA